MRGVELADLGGLVELEGVRARLLVVVGGGGEGCSSVVFIESVVVSDLRGGFVEGDVWRGVIEELGIAVALGSYWGRGSGGGLEFQVEVQTLSGGRPGAQILGFYVFLGLILEDLLIFSLVSSTGLCRMWI